MKVQPSEAACAALKRTLYSEGTESTGTAVPPTLALRCVRNDWYCCFAAGWDPARFKRQLLGPSHPRKNLGRIDSMLVLAYLLDDLGQAVIGEVMGLQPKFH